MYVNVKCEYSVYMYKTFEYFLGNKSSETKAFFLFDWGGGARMNEYGPLLDCCQLFVTFLITSDINTGMSIICKFFNNIRYKYRIIFLIVIV